MATAMATVMATATARTRKNHPVAGAKKLTRKAGPIGVALMVWDVWRRIPPRQRRWLFKQARTHGPRVAKQVVASRAKKRR